MIAGGFKVAVVGAILLLAVHRLPQQVAKGQLSVLTLTRIRQDLILREALNDRDFWDAAVAVDPTAGKLDERHMPLEAAPAPTLGRRWRPPAGAAW